MCIRDRPVLAWGPPAVGDLIGSLRDAPEAPGRQAALCALGELGNAEAVPFLIEQAVADEVETRGVADRVTVSSDHRQVLESIRRLTPGVTTTWIAWFRDWRWWMWYVAGRVRQLRAERVAPPAGQVTEAMVKYLHSRGVVVRAWGVGRDESLASRMISLGVDGMTFDDHRRIAELLNAEEATTTSTTTWA